MDELIQRAGAQGVQEIVIGMAHRGRLNVLVNTLGKMPKDLFAEFEGQHADELPSGDVKYHQGFSSDISTPGGPVHLSLAFNPSHLEIVNPVVEGSCKARMDRRADDDGSRCCRCWCTATPPSRAGRRDGDAQPRADARLRHLRHRAHRDQQPDRFHHFGPARHPLDHLLLRRRQDDRGAGAPRERRRPGRGGVRDPDRAGLPPAVPQGRGGRHRLFRKLGHNEQDTPAVTSR